MSYPRSASLPWVALLLALPACRRPPEGASIVRLGDVFHAGRAAQPAPAAAAPKARVEWRFDAPALEDAPPNQGWVAVTGVEGLAVREGRLVGRATTTLPVLHVSHAVGGDPDTLHEVQVRMRASAGRNLAVAFLPDEKPDLETYLRIVQADPADGSTPIVAGEEMRTYSFKRPESFAASEIRHVALRPTDAVGARFEIESIRLVFRKEHLAGIPSGLSWQGLSGVYRETLVARAPEALALEVTLPKRPWLDLALGTISEEAATFEVNVDAGRGKQRLLTRTLTTPHRWEPLALDLGAYAGRTVKLELRLASPHPGTLGFWGSSVVRNRSPSRAAGAVPPRGVIVVWA
ncbi:MAG TPA: hypothetical protein VI589_08670, partial [Vicinamibacteria bacterium]